MDYKAKYNGNKGYEKLVSLGWYQMIDNMENDSALTEDMKEAFREHLKIYNGSDIKEYNNNFFRKEECKFKGIEASDVYGTMLGHTRRREQFISKLRNILIKERIVSDMIGGEILAKSLMVDINDAGKEKDFSKKAIKIYNLSSYEIAEYSMWSFRGPEGDTYTGYDKEDLPCLLGLPGKDGITGAGYDDFDYITFEFLVPPKTEIKVCKPTAFDAETNILWRSDGKTKKHDDGGKYPFEGLDEFFHKSIKFSNIESNIYNIWKQ